MADIKYIVTMDASGALKEIKPLEDGIGGLKDKSEKADASFAGLWRQFALGQIAADALKKTVKSLVDFVGDSVKAAIDAEDAENNLRSALESTGRTVGPLADHFLKYSQELQKNTIYEDDVIQGAQALLLQLTRLDKDGIDVATKGAIGLASVFKMDLESAARMVAQGYEGNYIGLGKLIPAIKDAKTETEKQAAMTDGLARMYERARAETETFGGSLKQLGNFWGDVKEAVGGVITKNPDIQNMLADAKKKIVELIESGKIEEWATKASSAISKLVGQFDLFLEMIQALPKGFAGLSEVTASKWAGDLTGENKRLAEAVKEARAKAIEFRDSLQVLKPTTEEMRKEIEKGPEAWAAYTARLKDSDEKLVANKASIEAAFGKFKDFLGLYEGAPAKINETGNAIKDAGEKTKTLAEQLGIVTKTDLEKKLHQYRGALVLYGKSIPLEEQEKLKKLIKETEDKLYPATNAVKAFGLGLDDAKDSGGKFDDVLKLINSDAREAKGPLDELADSAINIGKKMDTAGQDTKKYMKDATEQSKGYFDGLYNDIATGWGNTLGDWIEKQKLFNPNFLELWKGLWEDLKDTAFRKFGELATSWLLNFIEPAKGGIKEIKDGLSSVVGGTKDIAASAGSAASGFLSAAGSVGSIISGITGVIELLKGPQKQTDITYWLKYITDHSQDILNYLTSTQVGKLQQMTEQLQDLVLGSREERNQLQAIVDISNDIRKYTGETSSYLSKAKWAAAGIDTVVSSSTMFIAGESGAERVTVQPMAGGQASSASVGSSMTVHITINALDGADAYEVTRNKIAPILMRMSRTGHFSPARG